MAAQTLGGITFQLSAGNALTAPNAPSPFAAAAGLRMLNRDRTASVTLTAASLVVETSTYVQFEQYREIVRAALEALGAVDEIPGMQRVGLRYLDEIRIPGVERPSDWTPYVHDALHGPIGLLDATARVTQGLVEYEVGDNRQLVMRYGASSGWAVDPTGPVRVPESSDGPFFLLDIDSFWTAPQDLLPEYSLDAVISVCNELHAPVRTLFEASITDKLRDDVLRREVSS